MSVKKVNEISTSKLKGLKSEYRRAGISDEGIAFLIGLREYADIVDAYKATAPVRENLSELDARRRVNVLMGDLNRSHPGLVARVIEQANLLARQKMDLACCAMLDHPDEEKRAEGLQVNLKRFKQIEEGASAEPTDRDLRPVATAVLTVEQRAKRYENVDE